MTEVERLQVLEAALRARDWMRVMDVVEDMGGNPNVRLVVGGASHSGQVIESGSFRSDFGYMLPPRSVS